MTPENRTFLDGMAFASQSLSISFICALVKRRVIDGPTAIELIDSAMLGLEEQRAAMPPEMHPSCDMARSQLNAALRAVSAEIPGEQLHPKGRGTNPGPAEA